VKRPSRIALAASVLVLVTAGGGLALAAGNSLTLELKGQYAKRSRSACGKAHKRFRFFHRGATIEGRGFLTPHPAGHFAVRLQIKRCAGRRWIDIGNRFAQGKKLTGKYKAFFSARPLAPRSHKRGAHVYYRAQAIVGTAQSTNEYFAVTN
jgi:hypothetical protein